MSTGRNRDDGWPRGRTHLDQKVIMRRRHDLQVEELETRVVGICADQEANDGRVEGERGRLESEVAAEELELELSLTD